MINVTRGTREHGVTLANEWRNVISVSECYVRVHKFASDCVIQ